LELNLAFLELSMRGKLLQTHSLANYTSWKIGGPADYFYQPADLQDLQLFLQASPSLPITVLGAGTNILIPDDNIRGTVIYLRNCLNQIDILGPSLALRTATCPVIASEAKQSSNNNALRDFLDCRAAKSAVCNDESADNFRPNEQLLLRVEAGFSLSLLLKHCIDLGAIDAIFMSGIPGTVGGALAMNAGANGGSIWQFVKAVEVINQSGQIITKDASEFKASYRQVTGLKPNEWFVAAHLNFNTTKDQDKIEQAKQKIANYLQKRKDTQPLDLPNCGSVFRNPLNDYAARLIEASGFKGKQIGGAQVSTKHANFIVNQGDATALDILQLIQGIMRKVKQDHDIELIPEVRIISYD